MVDLSVLNPLIRLTFWDLFDRLTAAEVVALVADYDGLIATAPPAADILAKVPADLRPAGVLQFLDWSHLCGALLTKPAERVFADLKAAFEADVLTFLDRFDYDRLYELLDDGPTTAITAEVRPAAVVSGTLPTGLSADGLPGIVQPAGGWMLAAAPRQRVSPSRAAAGLKAPVGYKVLRGTLGWDQADVLEDAVKGIVLQDYFDGQFQFTPSSYPTGHPGVSNPKARYRGPWMDRWKDCMKAKIKPWLQELAKLVPDLNVLEIDVETPITFWEFFTQKAPDGTGAHTQITRDSRFPELLAWLCGIPYEPSKWRHGDEPSSKFNEACQQLQARYLMLLSEICREIWPTSFKGLLNYQNSRKCSALQKLPQQTRFGWQPWGVGTTLDLASSIGHFRGSYVFYDRLTNTTQEPPSKTPTPSQHPDQAVWDLLRGQLGMVRSHTLASRIPYTAFIANRRSLGAAELRGYEELLIHLLFQNAADPPILHGWFAATASGWTPVDRSDLEAIQRVLTWFNSVVVGTDRKTLAGPVIGIDHSSTHLISGLDVGGRKIWRVSPTAPNASVFEDKAAKFVNVVVNGTAVGFYDATILPNQELSPYGYTIVQDGRSGVEARVWDLSRSACTFLVKLYRRTAQLLAAEGLLDSGQPATLAAIQARYTETVPASPPPADWPECDG